jgi:phosphatidylglycerol:prolipoprotein diacylglycerol transferase
MRPVLIKIGELTIHSWGALVAIAFATGLYIVWRDAKRVDVDQSKTVDFGLWALVLALIGARMVYVLLEPKSFLGNPVSILFFQNGGLSIHGALLGGSLAGWLFTRKNNIPFFRLADLVAPPLALAQGIGRVGCFLNGCCYGKVTSIPWAVKFNAVSGLRHPTQLYESGLDILVFLFLWGYRKKARFEGEIFLFYLIAYSVVRIFVEFFRDDTMMIWPLTLTQLISLPIIFISAIFIFIRNKQANREQ